MVSKNWILVLRPTKHSLWPTGLVLWRMRTTKLEKKKKAASRKTTLAAQLQKVHAVTNFAEVQQQITKCSMNRRTRTLAPGTSFRIHAIKIRNPLSIGAVWGFRFCCAIDLQTPPRHPPFLRCPCMIKTLLKHGPLPCFCSPPAAHHFWDFLVRFTKNGH